MKKNLIFIILVFFIFSCGKKGPIDLSTDYSDSNINGPSEETTISLKNYYTNRTDYDLNSHLELWVGFSKNREVRSLIDYNISENINLDNGPFYLKLYIAKNMLDNTSFKIARCTAEWKNSEATWEERIDGTSWNWTEDITNPITVTEENIKYDENQELNYAEIDISSYVEYWKNNQSENYGLVIYSESQQQDYNIISFHSTNSNKDNKPVITYEYTNEQNETVDEEINAYADIHIAESFTTTNLSSTTIIGDGYNPVFTIDFDENNIDPKWEILDAHLVFSNYDTEILETTLDISLNDIDKNQDYLFSAIVKNSDAENFSFSSSIKSPMENYGGNFSVNVTDILNQRINHENPISILLFPTYPKTMLRAVEFLSAPELKITYRENPEG
ncbi:MAG: DNRLRE domain-containing protein [Candidatus Mcinerneyibacterium aminivorans]|uniref:DNRLRE domain-containing protein n=1 Tax=Candidatus Mcinerneyibacterium aminivorans TaxID=2703815 RepID=A0A5D0MHC3_9BACT|nr:MAG: DNRLRE domain-containing protein [Candidatus Mcinerneyibacterium aminivorans]